MDPAPTVPDAADAPGTLDASARTADAWRTVDEAAGAARLLGAVFILLGVVVLAPVLKGRAWSSAQWLAVANALVLIGPGVWYWLASSLIGRLDARAATVALRVAAAQGALVAAGLVMGATAGRSDLSRLAIPAMLALFFMPAVAALAYHLWQARAAMNVLGGGATGFTPVAPRPAIPVAEQAPDEGPTRPK